jgi:hypothetical protein
LSALSGSFPPSTAAPARLRYAFLFVIAAVPLLGVGRVKPSPLAVAAAFFVAHGFFSVAGRGDSRFLPRDLLSALLLLGCFVGSGIVVFTLLALALFPAVTSDGHPVMPIGQAFPASWSASSPEPR